MAFTLKPVDEMPGNSAGETRDLFKQFLESGARYSLLEGATDKDRARLQSASVTFNRNWDGDYVKVRARGEDTYLERVAPEKE